VGPVSTRPRFVAAAVVVVAALGTIGWAAAARRGGVRACDLDAVRLTYLGHAGASGQTVGSVAIAPKTKERCRLDGVLVLRAVEGTTVVGQARAATLNLDAVPAHIDIDGEHWAVARLSWMEPGQAASRGVACDATKPDDLAVSNRTGSARLTDRRPLDERGMCRGMSADGVYPTPRTAVAEQLRRKAEGL
jgi:hypothetical protein